MSYNLLCWGSEVGVTAPVTAVPTVQQDTVFNAGQVTARSDDVGALLGVVGEPEFATAPILHRAVLGPPKRLEVLFPKLRVVRHIPLAHRQSKEFLIHHLVVHAGAMRDRSNDTVIDPVFLQVTGPVLLPTAK